MQVTPSSKVVGDLAQFMVAQKLSAEEVSPLLFGLPSLPRTRLFLACALVLTFSIALHASGHRAGRVSCSA